MINDNSFLDSHIDEKEILGHLEAGLRLILRKMVRIILQEFQKQLDPTLLTIKEPDKNEKLTYSVNEAAELLGISRNAAYQAVKRNQIPNLKFGSRIVIPRVAIERMLLESSH